MDRLSPRVAALGTPRHHDVRPPPTQGFRVPTIKSCTRFRVRNESDRGQRAPQAGALTGGEGAWSSVGAFTQRHRSGRVGT